MTDSARQVDRPALRRPIPPVDGWAGFFWRSGGDGRLRILHCHDCGLFIHPPMPVCPRCTSLTLSPAEVSGDGRVRTFTVNQHPWFPGMPPPYVVAEVQLVEQEGLVLTTNIVDCPIARVRRGMAVRVLFEQAGEAFVPVFRPLDIEA